MKNFFRLFAILGALATVATIAASASAETYTLMKIQNLGGEYHPELLETHTIQIVNKGMKQTNLIARGITVDVRLLNARGGLIRHYPMQRWIMKDETNPPEFSALVQGRDGVYSGDMGTTLTLTSSGYEFTANGCGDRIHIPFIGDTAHCVAEAMLFKPAGASPRELFLRDWVK